MNKYSEVLNYWNQDNVESMYDKFLLKQEIEMIKKHIPASSKILDAGCGEGEGTYEYSQVPGSLIHASDFADTRLKKVSERVKNQRNVLLKKVNFLKKYELDFDYDVIISQRFLINIMEWEFQKKVINDFVRRLKVNGKLILLEGSKNGVNELNNFRKIFELPEISVKWHNLFFNDKQLENYLNEIGIKLVYKVGFSEYFILTRGIRPFFDKELNWNSKFNKISANDELKKLLKLGHRFSRLKLWVGIKNNG